MSTLQHSGEKKRESRKNELYYHLRSLLKALYVKNWVRVAQLYPTLCDPMDYTIHGILQTRTLEWVA